MVIVYTVWLLQKNSFVSTIFCMTIIVVYIRYVYFIQVNNCGDAKVGTKKTFFRTKSCILFSHLICFTFMLLICGRFIFQWSINIVFCVKQTQWAYWCACHFQNYSDFFPWRILDFDLDWNSGKRNDKGKKEICKWNIG